MNAPEDDRVRLARAWVPRGIGGGPRIVSDLLAYIDEAHARIDRLEKKADTLAATACADGAETINPSLTVGDDTPPEVSDHWMEYVSKTILQHEAARIHRSHKITGHLITPVTNNPEELVVISYKCSCGEMLIIRRDGVVIEESGTGYLRHMFGGVDHDRTEKYFADIASERNK